jgi:hypothetical protein
MLRKQSLMLYPKGWPWFDENTKEGFYLQIYSVNGESPVILL